jgi:hypothetical protein
MSAPEIGQIMTIEQRSQTLRRHHEERAAALFAMKMAMHCGVLVLLPLLPARKSRATP